MNTDSLPKPLTHARFYILLALATNPPLHGYALAANIHNASLGSLKVKDGSLYPLLSRMCSENLIERINGEEAIAPKAPVSYQITARYHITNHGRFTLKTDLKRLEHALKIAKANNLETGPQELPIEIQRLILQIRSRQAKV